MATPLGKRSARLMLSLSVIANALPNGRVRGNKVVASGPEAASHKLSWKQKRRTVTVYINGDDIGVNCHHPDQEPIDVKDWVRRLAKITNQFLGESLAIARYRGCITSGAMAVNLTCALMLARFRAHGGSLTRTAFLSARNDVRCYRRTAKRNRWRAPCYRRDEALGGLHRGEMCSDFSLDHRADPFTDISAKVGAVASYHPNG